MSDLEITQVDREVAAAFYGSHLARPNEVLVTAHMRAGKIDESPLIQAFARHRIAEREACAMVAEDFIPRATKGVDTFIAASISAVDIAAAIRARSDRADDISYAGVK